MEAKLKKGQSVRITKRNGACFYDSCDENSIR